MNRISIFLSLIIAISGLNAQNADWCATDEKQHEYHQSHPEKYQEYLEQLQQISKSTSLFSNKAAPTVTIPVVVHVIHDNNTGNISKAQILDGIDVLNTDFQKLNPDTSQIRSLFQPIAADCQIQFRLAKIDPNGNCTEGINRVESVLTYDADDAVKATSYWDGNKYFNVWIVNTIAGSGRGGGSVLGYAQFPGSSNGPINTYGIVVRNDEWGSVGTASSSIYEGRAATHEVGHCLGLFHTFQSGCGGDCTSTGDFVCDTPPSASPSFTCSSSRNSCSNDTQGGGAANPYTTNVPDQYENYMSYDGSCQIMYTEGQKSRMMTIINVVGHLQNLTANANLVATGTNDGHVPQTCAPIADITQTEEFLCEGGQVSFQEHSYNGPITSYDWSFPGGTPSSSSSATPTITYNTAGDYDVILRVSNSAGADTVTVNNIIHVSDQQNADYTGFNFFDGFESNNFDTEWHPVSENGIAEWSRSMITSFSGSYCAYLPNNQGTIEGETDYLVSPSIDLTNVLNPVFKFKVAYKQRNSSSNDQLLCAVSDDCGESWVVRFFASASTMSSGTTTNNFIPTASEWKDITVTLPSSFQNSSHVMFRFDFRAGGGNNIYLDDFRVDGAPVGVNEIDEEEQESLSVFPNPAEDIVSIKLNSKLSPNSVLYISDILGKKVEEVFRGNLSKGQHKFKLDTKAFEPGVYFVSLQTLEGRKTKKLIIK